MYLRYEQYTLSRGLEKIKTKTAALLLAATLVLASGLGLALASLNSAGAATGPIGYTTTPFNASEVALWVPDRTSPTGGYNSTTFADRNNVLEMRIDGSLRSSVGFHQTEGLQRDIPDSDSIKADVYVDSAWGSQTVRAGLWGVAHDETDAISSYPIIEYSTDAANGWRYWSVDHWTTLPTVPVKAGWNTLAIIHDDANNTFDYLVNDVVVATGPDQGSATIAAAILNSKNYAVNYAAHWSNFAYGNVLTAPVSKDDCKNGYWATYSSPSFKNQGLCVAAVQSSANSKHNQ